jgi:hypothetical protein
MAAFCTSGDTTTKQCLISCRTSPKPSSQAIQGAQRQGDSWTGTVRLIKISIDYPAFLAWIHDNSDLLEYLREQLQPDQWLSHVTVDRLAVHQATSTRADKLFSRLPSLARLIQTPHQSLSSIVFDTDRSITPLTTEEATVCLDG